MSLNLLGVGHVKASKRFYVDRGLAVEKSFGSKYVQFEAPSTQVKLALSGRRAKDVGVAADGTGSHRIVIGGDAGPSRTRTGSRGRPRRFEDDGVPRLAGDQVPVVRARIRTVSNPPKSV